MIDDIGDDPRDETETSVLDELVMHRYDHRFLLVTSNEPLSKWENVFSISSMMMVVASLVDYNTLIQINGASHRRGRDPRSERALQADSASGPRASIHCPPAAMAVGGHLRH